MKLSKKNQSGFAFIDLLIVVGVLTFLLVITVIAIAPAREYAQTNNAKRRSDINAILNAVNQYAADNKGSVPSGITVTAQHISKNGADLCAALIPQYISALPSDPKAVNKRLAITDCNSAYDTNYTIMQNATSNKITVAAPDQEIGEVIFVTR